MTVDMRNELLSAQMGAGLQIDWALVSWAVLLWADGICQTMLELEVHQELAGADAWWPEMLALRDSSQCSWLHIWARCCTYFDAVKVPGSSCHVSLQVESVLGHDVTDIVQRCLSVVPDNRPTMAEVAEAMAPSLYPHML